MSQEKVDRYKEQKRNRKAILAKKKRNALISRICAGAAVAALACWIGYSVMDNYQAKQNSKPVTADISALDEYTASFETE